jgi:hypothetical protein
MHAPGGGSSSCSSSAAGTAVHDELLHAAEHACSEADAAASETARRETS